MRNKLISIVAPVYNVEPYLDDFVNSILEQTYPDWEIIFIDDGSTDNSGSICDQWALKDHRIRCIHQKNGGQGAARNAGLLKAKGEYVTFADTDDTLSKDFLQHCIDDAVKYDADIVCCDFQKVINGVPQGRFGMVRYARKMTDIHQLFQAIQSEEQFYRQVTSKLYRTSLIQKQKFTSIRNGEDTVFFLQIFQNCEKFPVIYLDPVIGNNYRIYKDLPARISELAPVVHVEHMEIGRQLYKTAKLTKDCDVMQWAFGEYINYVYNGISYTIKQRDHASYRLYEDKIREYTGELLKEKEVKNYKLRLLSVFDFSPQFYWNIMSFPLSIRKKLKK